MKKYDVVFDLPTYVVNGQVHPEEYVEKLAAFLVNEFIYSRRFDFENLRKLVDIAEQLHGEGTI